MIAEQEWTCISRSGQQIPVKMTLAPLHQTDGETSGFLVLLHDLREQRRAESQRQHLETQLFQTQRLESLGTMAGGIAHDFNNILTAILGNVQLMQRLVPEGSHAAEYLKDIHSAARRASSLTQQLLSFSRGQNSERSSINLNVLISNLLRMLQRIIGEDIEISFLPSETISHVLANVSQMEQVLVNLVVNARDAMPDGGSLLILTSPAKTASMHSSGHKSIRAGEYIQLSIVDSGTGMDAATLAHVFEPFFTTRSPGTGTGLGLPVVRGIIEQHGGFIHLDSTEGQGTRVDIFLPVPATDSQSNINAQPGQEAGGKSDLILMAEDDERRRQPASEASPASFRKNS
jgi:signal transduction histidine kinase